MITCRCLAPPLGNVEGRETQKTEAETFQKNRALSLVAGVTLGNACISSIYPPPQCQIKVRRDSLVKICNNPGGDWNLGWRVDPMYINQNAL